MECPNKHEFLNLLLDSSLILATNTETYNIKLVICGDYIQLYSFSEKKIKTIKNLEKIDKPKSFNFIDTDSLHSINNINNFKENKIEAKNVNRSKLECQRIAKANASNWKTFITLTFEENVDNIDIANKEFKKFIDKVRRKFKDLKYICIPEFQKRGAVHFHLLTNISIDNKELIYCQEDNPKFKHVKYWNNGFTKVDNIDKNIKKIIGYISKYMTKDIDNRLFNRHRYLCSRNLIKPKVTYLDSNNSNHLKYLVNILSNKTEIYNNIYKNEYNDDLIEFKEFL